METTTRKGNEMTRQTHETVDVHDITGKLRNRLEQMSIQRGTRQPGGNWKYSHGWIGRDGQKWDLYTREISVENRNLSQTW